MSASQGRGCAISTASSSLMTEVLKGKTLDEAHQLFARLPRQGDRRRATPELPEALEDDFERLTPLDRRQGLSGPGQMRDARLARPRSGAEDRRHRGRTGEDGIAGWPSQDDGKTLFDFMPGRPAAADVDPLDKMQIRGEDKALEARCWKR